MTSLEEIKMLLGINDDSKDILIEYYYHKVIEAIKDYCNIPQDETLSKPLNSFAIFKTAEIIGSGMSFNNGGGSGSEVVGGTIKSVSRGDTTIIYGDEGKDGGNSSGFSSSLLFSRDEKNTLNKHRRIRFC